ncbi:uncharacterized protein LOC128930403 [Callithrix jacchus]
MARAESGAGVSSPLPLAWGSFSGVVPVPPARCLQRAAAECVGSPVCASEDSDGGHPVADTPAACPPLYTSLPLLKHFCGRRKKNANSDPFEDPTIPLKAGKKPDAPSRGHEGG